ncbi:hypothetical protein QYE76_043842 [Lolium multiflorum]|uniref:Integrase catalytic domain-containing protein n=1 Tax=Lolium multiflorum TaxID=4521 RepID=A0AAD8TJS5_LOLMU|nr:hypothetical protein QYE76_043842 [Lolium multiflorum]
MRLPDEDHEDMYARLVTVADAFRIVGATHINDSWIKDKYIDCMMSFEPIDVKTLVGRECYSSLTSQQAVHEMQALKVLEQNSHDSRNRAIGNNLALTVNSVEEVQPQEQYRAYWSMTYPEDLKCHYHDHMAFHAKSFWVDPSKSKEDNIKRNNKSGFTSFGPKTRSCYNCDDKRHFIAECPYENRENHNGRLIPKDNSKESKEHNRFLVVKTKKGKRPPKVVLVTREEYSSNEVESSSDDEEEESSKEVAAIVTTNIPSSSLFESTNENPHIKNAHCFMARSSLDTSIVLSTQEEYTSGDDDVDDEEDATSNGLVALASLSTNSSSPSESPNEIIHVEEESCLMAKSSEDYAAGGSKWVLDSGCTSHMTGGKNLVKELRPNINNITVSFGDNSTSEVLGFGKVVVAHNITFVDVMLVKTLGYNLLSVFALGKMGFAVFIDNDIVVLLWSKTLKVAFVGYREHNLYVVDFSGTTTSSAMCLFGKADVGWLWHRRLAHVNMRTLQSLHKGNHIVGLMENVSFAKDRVCRACVEGKIHDSPHPSKIIISSKRILEVLHVDLSGPTTHASFGGKKYCLVIVDDYSRYTWVFFLKTKDETQQIFIDFATEVQRQHNLLIMAIRSDNGSEFKNYTLNDFLSEEGIIHQYSAAYTPQQNGVAERKNRTLLDMARSMMAEYKSRYNFWAEVISIACHSSNRLYLRKGLNKTPYEILTGNKPNISYFKVFGCKCFYKIKGVRLSKFAPKALEGIFVGYGAESHTYRVFDISSNIIIESCSVKFEENDGSQVGQVDVCAGDEIPQDAIVRMGVGFFRPIEGHGVASREGLCSTTVEPSSSQHQQTPSLEANVAPTQEQEENPHSHVQDQGQDQSRIHDGSDEFPFDVCTSPNIVQDQAHEVEHSQEIEEAPIEGQDGDPNDQVDQVTPPRPRKTKEEIEARRLARRERTLEICGHTHDKVLGDVRAKVSTRRQLANFSNHHAYISVVEPKKVFEALEDSDWVEAMHEELNNFKRNKVWTLVEKPKECRNVIGTKWIFKNKQDEFGNIVRNKARLVAQGFSQVEGIDFGETYAPWLALSPSLMTDRFEMSMMGEMKFFLGLEIKQLREGTFINQAKYLQDMLKRFKMTELKGVATPMVTKCHLALDPNGRVSRGARRRPRGDRSSDEFTLNAPRKSSASRQKNKDPRENYKTMDPVSYSAIRMKNWYEDLPRDEETEGRKFWCMEQEYIYKDIYEPMPKVRPMQAINVEDLSENNHFEDAIWVTGRMGLQDLMKIRCDYSPELVKQFFATLAIQKDEDRTMEWMTGSTHCSATLRRFAGILGVPAGGGRRLHGPHKTDKNVLFDLYTSAGKVGSSKGLLPIYSQLLRFFRATISPSGCNNDALRGTLVDLMHLSFRCARDTNGERNYTIDVMDFIFNEIHDAMVSRTTIPYAPYIQLLINNSVAGDGVDLSGYSLVKHSVKKAYKLKPVSSAAPAPDSFMGDARSSGFAPARRPDLPAMKKHVSRLSWFQRHILCMNIEIHKENYAASRERSRLIILGGHTSSVVS